jgi:ATP-dependent protease ClpP protease subunit
MKKTKEIEVIEESLIYWFDYKVDINNRTIYMGSSTIDSEGESGVDASMVENFIKGLHALEIRDPSEKINIIMNNPGGDWYHGMAIYDAIKASPCFISIKVYGYAMSMGSVILQAASERIMMPNSRLMIHYGTDGINSHPKIVQSWAEEGRRNNMEMENIYIDSMSSVNAKSLCESLNLLINRVRSKDVPPSKKVNYKLSVKKSIRRDELRSILRDLLNFDTILSSEETVSLGLADEVFKNK